MPTIKAKKLRTRRLLLALPTQQAPTMQEFVARRMFDQFHSKNGRSELRWENTTQKHRDVWLNGAAIAIRAFRSYSIDHFGPAIADLRSRAATTEVLGDSHRSEALDHLADLYASQALKISELEERLSKLSENNQSCE